MKYVIEAELMDGPNWFGGLSVFQGKRVVNWTPYFDDAIRLTDEEGKMLMEDYALSEQGKCIPTHKAQQNRSAKVFELNGAKYMSRPVRVRELHKSDIFIENGRTYKVNGITNGYLMVSIVDPLRPFPARKSHSNKSRHWVTKIFPNTKISTNANVINS